MAKWTNVAPLTGGFMITSMLGFVISVIYVFPRNVTWGFTFAIFFAIMFLASMISMTYGPDAGLYPAGYKKK
jgi:hypothetical protein